VGEIGVGLVGYGLAGRAFHAPFVAAVDGLRLVAIVTTDPERLAQAAVDHPEADLVDSSDDLLDRDDVELVVVATPNSQHAPIAARALGTGRHVVVDKPIGLSVAEGEGLVEAAARSGGSLSVYQNRRWDGDFLTVQELLASDAVGAIDSFESRFERFAPVGPEWREQASEAGGPLRDLGAHLVDQSLLLFGPARRVWAQVDRRRPGTAVEDSVFVAIDHATGARSRLWTSLIASHVGPRYRLRGTRGEYVKRDLDLQESQLVAGWRPTAEGFGEEPPERWGHLHRPDGSIEAIPTRPGRYIAYYEGMRDAIRDGGSVPVDPQDSIRALRVLEAAERAAASGAAQALASA
jgi:predicted dehydrogenase